MIKEVQHPWAVTQDVEDLATQFLAEERAEKEAWLRPYKEGTPLSPTTQEPGAFAGLFGHTTGAGARIFPYYKTEGNCYFYEYTDPCTKQVVTKRLDLEEVERNQSAVFYTEAAFLGDEAPRAGSPPAGAPRHNDSSGVPLDCNTVRP